MTDKGPKRDDPAQAERFEQLVEKLKHEGKLDADPDGKLGDLVKKVLPVRRKANR